MIAAFLAPYPLRGISAPYLWVFYKLLSSIEEPMAFLVSAEYLSAADDPAMAGRDEFDPERMAALGYGLPDKATLARHHFSCLDSSLMAQLLEQHSGNPLAVFKAFLSEEIEELKADLRIHFDRLPADLEAVLTWCNCPSLNAVARERGLRVVNLEVGPLRAPQYRSTAYFDFSGVNGNTEAEKRYESADFDAGGVSFEEMRKAFERLPPPVSSKGDLLGIVLQVEDDSNLLCFNNGFDNISLIARGMLLAGEERLLVRGHPGSRFDLRDGKLRRDTSSSTMEFFSLCNRVLTINSSVGLEALLHEVPVQVQGDASFLFIAQEQDPLLRASKLAFYLSAYLVPFDLVFSVEYIRFRLSAPSEAQIIARHQVAYCDDAVGEAQPYSGVQEMFLRMQQPLLPSIACADDGTMVALEDGCRLYFRQSDEEYSEGASLRAEASGSASEKRVRFLLPPGVRPDYIRFDPARHSASFELIELGWGWGVAAGDHELHVLEDLPVRVSGVGGLEDCSRGWIKSFSDSDEAFFECSVGDLWLAVDGNDVGCGIIEFRFVERSLELESAYGHVRAEVLLSRIESGAGVQLERLLQMLEGMNSGSDEQLSRMEELRNILSQLAVATNKGDAAIEAMERDVSALIQFLRNKPTLWARITKSA